ncbi:MAG: hypothetical protein PHH32_00165 [Eubacteriales bacterium]|jgi:hypothetical protein|nr:hypothetical protein [Eubacteriales bacterium]
MNKESKNLSIVDEEELELAQEDAKAAQGTFTHTFKKPFSYNGTEYTSLTFDFEGLSGNDTLQIERELARKGRTVIVPEFNGDYLAHMASRACEETIGVDAFGMMSLRDFNAIRGAARRFLLNAE